MSGGPIDFAVLRCKRKAQRTALDLAAERSYCKVLSCKVPDILLACTEEASRDNCICLSGAIPVQNYTTRKLALKRLESSLKQTTDIVRSELRARKVRTSYAAAFACLHRHVQSACPGVCVACSGVCGAICPSGGTFLICVDLCVAATSALARRQDATGRRYRQRASTGRCDRGLRFDAFSLVPRV